MRMEDVYVNTLKTIGWLIWFAFHLIPTTKFYILIDFYLQIVVFDEHNNKIVL